MAPVRKILGVPEVPPGGSLGTGKRGTVPKIWHAVPIFLARVNGVLVRGVHARASVKRQFFSTDQEKRERETASSLILLLSNL